MIISENKRFRQEIHADQRHGLFLAHFQHVLDSNKTTLSFSLRPEPEPHIGPNYAFFYHKQG